MNIQFDEAGNILRPKRKLPKLPPLRTWQIKAREKWKSNNNGIVEAVTGSGKTIFAISIIKEFVNDKKKVLVVVPTEALLNQWYKELDKYFDKNIGLYYGRKKKIEDITVAIINSASKKDFGSHFDLLVADECHHTGARTFSKLLTQNKFGATLGISATPERLDSGFKDYMVPKLGRKIFTYSYIDALADKVICKFDFEMIPIRLEEKVVNQIDKMVKSLKKISSVLYHILKKNITMQEVLYHKRRLENLGNKALSYSKNKYLYKKLCEYTELSRNIGLTISRSEQRIYLFKELLEKPEFKDRKIIVFHLLKNEANKLFHIANKKGRETSIYHSDFSKSDNAKALDSFKQSTNGVLICVSSLDEGVDVPDADCAIILSNGANPRRIIQRVGRVLRVKEGKTAKIVLVYAKPQEDTLLSLNAVKELKNLSILNKKLRR